MTTPYNVDSDGEEMNLHLADSLESRVEINQLASVLRTIITPEAHCPVMDFVEDKSVTAVTKMTKQFLQQMLNVLPLYCECRYATTIY